MPLPLRPVALLAALVAALAVASLHVGLNIYGPATVWRGIAGGGTDSDALIVATLRLPRTLVAAVAGAALALSGLLMQAATRNPLAEPGLLGINGGAALAVAVTVVAFGATGMASVATAALVGALAATALVFGLALLGGGRADPTTLLLAGVTLAAMMGALTQVLLIVNETALETLLFWLAGGFADRELAVLRIGAPILALGTLAALPLAAALDAMRADDDTAAALGVAVPVVRLAALAIAAILAGGAVAMAGPVMFLGLVAPHLARRWPQPGGCAPGHAGLMALSLALGAALALAADILARVVVAPGEAPASTLLALVGVPVLISLLRRGAAVAR